MSTGSSAQAGSRAGAEFRLRTAPLELSTGRGPGRVDRRAGILYGVSVAQAVEALGHGLVLDETSLQQIAALGSAAPNGVKCRFSHPGLASDGLGKYLGRVKALRVEPASLDAPARVVGNLHLSRLAFASPAGDLGSYILDAAEQAPDALGLSVVMDIARVWVGPNGQETPLCDPQTNRSVPRPPGVAPLPVVRPLALYAVDMVDEPAANRGGLFSIAQVLHPVDGPALAVPETDSLIGEIYPMEETPLTSQAAQSGETSAAEAVPATTPDWSSALARSAARQMIAASGLPAPVQQRL